MIAFTALALAAGCTGSDGNDGTSPSPSATASAIGLISTGGDVFAWSQRIEGRGRCDEVTPLVGGQPADVPVEVGGDGFTFTIPVGTGPEEVSARCTTDGGRTEDTAPIELTGRLEDRPTARIRVRVADGRVELDGSGSARADFDPAPLRDFTWTRHLAVREHGADPAPTLPDGTAFVHPVGGRRLTLVPPSADGEYSVTLTIRDADGRTDESTIYFVVEGGRARAVDLMHEHPAWIDRAILYAPVHQLWGGGAKAVEEHLPYLKELGVDALWLWPPVTRRAFGEEYAIADYFQLDPEWGTPEEFRHMVRRAHELGLRVLLDFVPNHTSIEHRYFKTAEKEGPGSHYWDFYDRKPNGHFTHYFDWTHLPNLNYDEPQVRRMITEAFSYWIRRYDVDGFRVDAAWAVKLRRPGFWSGWREELKRIKPDLLLLAEATARDRYYFENGFDMGYDWTSHPGRWPWAGFWEFPQEIQSLSASTLSHRYPSDALVLRFLNNNDTSIRFVDQHGAPMTKVASALEFTVPGNPLLFAGDEIGASYQPYGTLEKIPWKDRHGLRPWYEGLIRIKRELPALWGHDIAVLSSDASSVVSFVRPSVPGGSAVLVLLNFGKATSITIDPSPALDEVLAAGTLEDALTGDRIAAPPGPVRFRLPAFGVRVYVPARGAA
jgi:cyclomaltodextrinase / maltogenic alpha-amylase / neopullulanase